MAGSAAEMLSDLKISGRSQDDDRALPNHSTNPSPLSSNEKKENLAPISSRIAELKESKVELLNRIQGLKKDLQDWRSKLDTQVKTYREELSELKKTLNVEVEQLRSEFQELKTTLQQQQEDVENGLSNLTISNPPKSDAANVDAGEAEKQAVHDLPARANLKCLAESSFHVSKDENPLGSLCDSLLCIEYGYPDYLVS